MTTCLDALSSMLDADLADLAGRGPSPLAAHLRVCARCHTVAARLLADTRALGAVVASAERDATPAPRHPVRAIAVAVTALAAALVLLLSRVAPHGGSRAGLTTARSSAPPSERIVVPPRVAMPTPRSRVATTAPRRPARPLTPPERTDVATPRVAPDMIARASAFEPVRAVVVTPVVASPVDPVPVLVAARVPSQALSGDVDADPNRITVEPKQGRRAVVMRTSDPTITVVWLY